jgi:hypothetical protein
MFAKLSRTLILLTKIGSYPHRMSPVTYVRTMLIMVGIIYSGAVVSATLDNYVLAILGVASATVALTHLMSIIHNG